MERKEKEDWFVWPELIDAICSGPSCSEEDCGGLVLTYICLELLWVSSQDVFKFKIQITSIAITTKQMKFNITKLTFTLFYSCKGSR